MKKILLGLFSISVFFFLLMSAIRILFTPLYLQWEYHRSYFPPDVYGFTTADRLHWGKISMEYIVSGVDISYLANQKLPDSTPLYNQREVSHMLDVQIVFQNMLTAWSIMAGLYLLMLWVVWKQKWWKEWSRALRLGGWITLGLVGAIMLGVAISFYQLFELFHQLFFTGDSWLFQYSDSLIRLFPLEFWRDAFIWMGVFTVIGAILAIVGSRWIERRLARSARSN